MPKQGQKSIEYKVHYRCCKCRRWFMAEAYEGDPTHCPFCGLMQVFLDTEPDPHDDDDDDQDGDP